MTFNVGVNAAKKSNTESNLLDNMNQLYHQLLMIFVSMTILITVIWIITAIFRAASTGQFFDSSNTWDMSKHNFSKEAYKRNKKSIRKYRQKYPIMASQLKIIFNALDMKYSSVTLTNNISNHIYKFNKLISALNASDLSKVLVQQNMAANNPSNFLSAFSIAIRDNELKDTMVRQYNKDNTNSVMSKFILYSDYLSDLSGAARKHEYKINETARNMKADKKFNSLFSNFSKIESINSKKLESVDMPVDNI